MCITHSAHRTSQIIKVSFRLANNVSLGPHYLNSMADRKERNVIQCTLMQQLYLGYINICEGKAQNVARYYLCRPSLLQAVLAESALLRSSEPIASSPPPTFHHGYHPGGFEPVAL